MNSLYGEENIKNVTVTHKGVWKATEDIEIECYVTDDRRRLMSLRGTARAIGLNDNNSRALLRNLQSKWIQPYLSHQLEEWIFRASEDKLARIGVKNAPAIVPFEANMFVDVCKAYIMAKNDKNIPATKVETADRLLWIMTAFAKVGIDSIVDEITGYQEERQNDELQRLLGKYISEEFLEWTKTFPDEFYEQLFRLRGWSKFGEMGRKMPGVVGYWTNDVVYARLPHGVLEELKAKTPKSEAGNKLMRYHQSLSEDHGVKHLEKHLVAVIALMKSSDDWNQFLYFLDRSYQRRGQQIMREFLF